MDILKRSINILCGSLDLDNTQRFYFLSKFLEDKDPTKEVLKRELHDIVTNTEFNLLALILENNELLENPNSYSRDELINYIKGWIWDYLYPEKVLTKDQIQELSKDVLGILRDYSNNDGWMFSYDLYNSLKEKDKYRDLEYYNLWKIDFKNYNIERKPIEKKDQEIGHLRYKKDQE